MGGYNRNMLIFKINHFCSKKSPYLTPDCSLVTPCTILLLCTVTVPLFLTGIYTPLFVTNSSLPPIYSESLFNDSCKVLDE